MSDDREIENVSSDPGPDAPVTSESPSPESSSLEAQGLRRSTRNRKIGGVAGGIGERFDIDANIVRVAFILLCFLWGLGAAIYLAMWALVPLSGTSSTSESEPPDPESKRFSLRTVVLILAALFVGLIFIAIGAHGFVYGRGLSVMWLVFLVALAVLSLRRPGRRLSLMRFVAGVFIAFLSFVILVTGAVLGYVALAGVPFNGGVGQTLYQPTSLTQVHRTYRMAAGRMTIDLRGVSFENHSIAITSTVGIGTLTIDVPDGVLVNLSAESGANSINYPLQGARQFFVTSSSGAHHGLIELTVKVGIGNINLIRATPGEQLPFQ
ncbi:MAG: PspC domain-containing protein [Acidimicrobiales bacterium]